MRLDSKKYLSCFFAATIAFAIVNVGLGNFGLLKTQPLTSAYFGDVDSAKACGKPGPWWMSKAYLEQKQAPDVVIFGSSQMGGLQAADAQTLNRTLDVVSHHRAVTVERNLAAQLGTAPQVFTLALPGAMASDHYLASKALFRQNLKPKIAIIGISPRDFMDNFLPAPCATEPFHFFSRFVELGSLGAVACPDILSRVDWLMTEKLPLRRLNQIVEGSAHGSEPQPAAQDQSGSRDANAKVVYDLQRKIRENELLSAAYTAYGDVKPGQCLISPNKEDFFVDNTFEYARRYKRTNPPIYSQEMTFFKQFLKTMEQDNIKVIAVGMPLYPSNRAQLPPSFWEKFQGDVRSSCQQYGANFVDYTADARFDPRDFVDTVHLNARGGAKLSALMAQAIVDNPRCLQALDTVHGRSGALIAKSGSVEK